MILNLDEEYEAIKRKKHREYVRKWRKENPEKEKRIKQKANLRYQLRHREEINKKSLDYYYKNKEEILKKLKEKREKEKEQKKNGI